MIQKIFTVYDQKAKAYLPPFFMHAEGMAVRAFADCVNNKEHQFGAHPEDYTLFCIGTFDDERCQLEPHKPLLLKSGLEVKVDERPRNAELPFNGKLSPEAAAQLARIANEVE